MNSKPHSIFRNLPVSQEKRYDVVIIGGGVSGAAAAIASARHGAQTLVVEQHGFMGGALAAMGVGPMMSFHNSAGRQLVKGIPQELVDRLMLNNASPGHIPDSITYCSTVTPIERRAPEIRAQSSGVCLRFTAWDFIPGSHGKRLVERDSGRDSRFKLCGDSITDNGDQFFLVVSGCLCCAYSCCDGG